MQHNILAATLAAALITGSAMAASQTAGAKKDRPKRTFSVERVGHTGRTVLPRPAVAIDSVNVNSQAFDTAKLPGYALNLYAPAEETLTLGEISAPSDSAQTTLHLLQFTLNTPQYAKATLKLKGLPDNKQIYLDRKEASEQLELLPGTHRVAVKYFADSLLRDTLGVAVECDSLSPLSVREDGRRLFSFDDNYNNTRVYSAVPSPDGQWFIYTTYSTTPDNRVDWNAQMRRANAERVADVPTQARWMPRTSRTYFDRLGRDGSRELVTVNPADGSETVIASGIPEGSYTMAPTEDFLIYSIKEEGPKELDSDVHQILNPEDRLKGWRTRYSLARYDLDTGVMQPLTYGYRNVSLNDISRDGRRVLFMTTTPRFTKRPTSLFSLYDLDLTTMKVDTLVNLDGFLTGAQYSPDGSQVLLSGSPEVLNRLGCRLPPESIPSMIENELYIMDLPSKQVRPMTADFDPNVQDYQWNPGDGMIYFKAEEGDRYSVFRLDPKSGKFFKLPIPEDYVSNFAIADYAPFGAAVGQGAESAGGAYTFDTKKWKMNLFDRPMDQQLADVDLPSCTEWYYINAKGDSIQCRYYLPADFDPAKQYPVIVNYYGGCSPTSRYFGGHYPHQLYASLGYIALVINPSGATGYGQEFASRHVKTAGQGVADDIIGAVTEFAKNPWVNEKKIGCVGASYGGFMTQYLQTVSDIFAAAVSHAGISDHTSYWGEGDWGYSYSETSMGDAYPWTDPDLYVKQSPLYNADKVHTPLLFLHGSIDNNVPIGESIQMFNALSLLGRPTAFVVIDGEQHGIMDLAKRLRWQQTMLAWFSKYLQDNPDWWEALYPEKSL